MARGRAAHEEGQQIEDRKPRNETPIDLAHKGFLVEALGVVCRMGREHGGGRVRRRDRKSVLVLLDVDLLGIIHVGG
jgi:hypothetical protein